jgi:hypothetical protein
VRVRKDDYGLVEDAKVNPIERRFDWLDVGVCFCSLINADKRLVQVFFYPASTAVNQPFRNF